ncbi:hypothetical protein BKA80DRAFT_280206 [Phyllosticta citrichinensis]
MQPRAHLALGLALTLAQYQVHRAAGGVHVAPPRVGIAQAQQGLARILEIGTLGTFPILQRFQGIISLSILCSARESEHNTICAACLPRLYSPSHRQR